jgi:hypothetical protein
MSVRANSNTRGAWIVAAALAFAAPVALQAQGPAGGLQPSEPAAIVAAARSCHDAVTPERLDEARLAADRWTRAPVTSDGREVETPLRIFSRDSVLLFALPDSAGCVVMARLRSRRGYTQVIEGLTAAFGTASRNRSNAHIWVRADGRAVQADATGDRGRPSARITVVHTGGNSSGTPK